MVTKECDNSPLVSGSIPFLEKVLYGFVFFFITQNLTLYRKVKWFRSRDGFMRSAVNRKYVGSSPTGTVID